MIIKLGESPNWEMFRKRSLYVKALRMTEDFLFETSHGWVQGYEGQWLVELGERVRHNIDHESFDRTYRVDRRDIERE